MWPCFNPWIEGAVGSDALIAGQAGSALLAGRQQRRLRTLLETAVCRSEFYRARGLFPSGAVRPFEQWPPVTKTELMQRFDRWVTDPRLDLQELRRFVKDPSRIGHAFADEFMVWESSGSSGEPGLFVQDQHAMAVYDALEAARRPAASALQRWFDPCAMADRFAFVGAIEGHFASTVTIERLRRLLPGMAPRLRGFSFMQTTASLVDQLNQYGPAVIATYPTAALMLSEEAAAGRLRLTLREVLTGGEQLSPAMRSLIEQRFGCPVIDSYGASEHLAIAGQCHRGSLHLNSDWVLLEPVDEHHKPMPIGEAGCFTLLTNLANHVQPLIRYELGDRVAFQSWPCECGSTLPVIALEGRTDDMLSMQGADGQPVRLLPLALTTALEEDAGLFDFQLTQRGGRSLRLALGDYASPCAQGLARIALAGFLHRQGLDGVRIEIAESAPLLKGKSGKTKRIVACRPKGH